MFVRPRRSAGGEFLLHAPCCNLSRRSACGESILHAPCCYLSRRSAGGESVLHPVQESRSVLESILSFVGRGICLTRPVLVAVLG